MKKSLIERLEGNPFLGDIRGMGLLLCIELNPKRSYKRVSKMLLNYFLKKGLYTRVVNGYIHLGPPLIITKEEVDMIIEIVASGFEKLANKVK